MSENKNPTPSGGEPTPEKPTPEKPTPEEPAQYSQADVDARIKEALAAAEQGFNTRLDEGIKEALRLAGLDEAERKSEEERMEKEAFAKEKAAFEREKLEMSAAKQLGVKNIPQDFAQLLTGTDAETTAKNIETFEKAWNEAVDKAVSERIQGRVPKNSGGKDTGNSMKDIISASMKRGF